jgi:hypothetical protein
MTSLAGESFLTTANSAAEVPQVAKLRLSKLAALGRLHELRTASKACFADRAEVDAAVAAAASNGRHAVLAFFATRGIELQADRLLRIAAVSGHRSIFSFFHERGAVVFSPDLVNLVLRNDRATIVRFWLENKIVEPSELLPDAAKLNALYCFHLLATSGPDGQSGSSYAAFLQTASLPERMDYLVGGRRAPAIIYTYLTPSESIDIDRASLVFLMYRRIMRAVTMGRLRR